MKGLAVLAAVLVASVVSAAALAGTTGTKPPKGCKTAGVGDVWIFATHGVFAGGSLDKFAECEDVTGIVVTDTLPIDPRRKPEKLTVVPVSGLLAETIMNVFADDSVSAIFGGENQLF